MTTTSMSRVSDVSKRTIDKLALAVNHSAGAWLTHRLDHVQGWTSGGFDLDLEAMFDFDPVLSLTHEDLVNIASEAQKLLGKYVPKLYGRTPSIAVVMRDEGPRLHVVFVSGS